LERDRRRFTVFVLQRVEVALLTCVKVKLLLNGLVNAVEILLGFLS
jgi:hypothetical protein